ncbi:hypothetical protein P152DRAFT_98877 [Eremomyces bilateralis CBS 781.70]|uniref:Rhodopsin domain-containing protein n=1 Tax=Eremomyces bilateralis CBS 781.70 TaxID=1392243 RepID=A0A6G1FXD9_9PEZI|nr:uncharacterized protein P152DRAFT_98877 [Eremomyces bilateralis CBS 781.70]KAF1810453.1 hypothetical protein P152DRAFT_98877 [Eremomyces bilateralis CBS 781.70]
MRDIPLEVLLTWPTPNYDDPVTRGSALIIVNSIFISLVALAVGLRLYARLAISRSFGADDVFIILALIPTAGLAAAVMLANNKYGWNRHVWDVPLDLFASSLKVAIAAKALYTVATTFTRISLLSFYYRFVRDTAAHRFRMTLHASLGFVVVMGVSFVCLAVFQCSPISAYWTMPAPEGAVCIDDGRATLAVGVVNCFADLIVTVLPIPLVMKLKMPLRQRIGVVVLLSLGFIVIIAGSLRSYYIWDSIMNSYDETWVGYPLWLAAAVEVDLGVICACAPALRPLIASAVPQTITSLSDRFTGKFSSNLSSKGTPSPSRALKSEINHPNGGDNTWVNITSRGSDVELIEQSDSRLHRSSEREVGIHEDLEDLERGTDESSGERTHSESHGRHNSKSIWTTTRVEVTSYRNDDVVQNEKGPPYYP